MNILESQIRYKQALSEIQIDLIFACHAINITTEQVYNELLKRAKERTETLETKDPIKMCEELYLEVLSGKWPK